MAVATVKRSPKKVVRRKSKQWELKEVPIKILPEELQRKIFEGDTIILGDSIGTCLEVEFPEWTPMFHVGGMACGCKKETGRNQ